MVATTDSQVCRTGTMSSDTNPIEANSEKTPNAARTREGKGTVFQNSSLVGEWGFVVVELAPLGLGTQSYNSSSIAKGGQSGGRSASRSSKTAVDGRVWDVPPRISPARNTRLIRFPLPPKARTPRTAS